MKQLKTGVPGLDEILRGGLLENSSVLVTGPPGTGKSIMALQFALGGIDNKEPALFITSDETSNALESNAKNLGIDINLFKNSLYIQEPTFGKGHVFSLKESISLIRKNKIKRVVLDSLTLFKYVYVQNELEFREGIHDFIISMKNMGVTLLVTSEKSINDLDNIPYEAQDFLFDGLIFLTKLRSGNSFERICFVSKMRGQNHILEAFPFTIKEGGITIYTKQLPFSLMGKINEAKH